MSAIFRTEFRDLQDADGNTTKASTAKFVCIALADHANDEGEGAYPSIGKIAYKTNLSRTAVINALDALKHNGILTAHGTSKWDTVNYTVKAECFSLDSQPALLVNPVDPHQSTQLTPPVNPVDPNHPLTIIKTIPDDEKQNVIDRANHKVDAYLDMMNAPGIKAEARRASIQSYLGERLHVNTETKAWREFAKYADGQQQKHGEKIETFVSWLLGQDKFQIQYWPPRRMQEMWPQAFMKSESTSLEASGWK